MGNCVCRPATATEEKLSTAFLTSIDTALPSLVIESHLKLLNLLREPLAQNELRKYAHSVDKMHLLSCWTDIEQFKDIEPVALKKEKANQIYTEVVTHVHSQPIGNND